MAQKLTVIVVLLLQFSLGCQEDTAPPPPISMDSSSSDVMDSVPSGEDVFSPSEDEGAIKGEDLHSSKEDIQVDASEGEADVFAADGGEEGGDVGGECEGEPEAPDEVGDSIDQNCDGIDGVDKDGDGYASIQSGGDDCVDDASEINSGAEDMVGNEVDENCDGIDGVDGDLDGFASKTSGGDDCNDKDEEIYPGATDMIGDGKDLNCDGMDGVDFDGDGYASAGSGGSDCNDYNDEAYPGAPDSQGDYIDKNCDGHDGVDKDGDGYGALNKGGKDCDDNDEDVNPGEDDEVGDFLDADCDGHDGVDEDGDNHASLESGGGDCDDQDDEIFPGASDAGGDEEDSNCDGVDGVDADGDGYASTATGGKDPNDGNALIKPPSNFDVAKHWAPVFYHDADDDNYEADYIVAVNFDGDYISDNNWDNLESPDANLGAVIYFSVIESVTHWFVLYLDFHPRDWAKDCSPFWCVGILCEPCHENDLEGAMVVVRKDTTTYGKFELLYTEAHNILHAFTNNSQITKLSHHGIESVPVTFEDGTHPELYVESKGHGVCALYFDGDQHGYSHCKHDVSNTPPEFGGGDGVVYRYKGYAEVPESGNDSDVSYSLRSMYTTLWSRRNDVCDDGCLFDKPMVYEGVTLGGAFDGDKYGEDKAMPPWAWDDPNDGAVYKGDFFFDPAYTLQTHFHIPAGVSQEYLYNPYLDP